jgi:hypothetical protein
MGPLEQPPEEVRRFGLPHDAAIAEGIALDTPVEDETLSRVLRAVANALDRREADGPRSRRAESPPDLPLPATEALAALARAYLRHRRVREQLFPEMFADPAWDLLLDLYAAAIEGRRVSVSSACIAAAVPPTTALRWIGILENQRLVVRIADPADRRCTHLQLSAEAETAVGKWLQGLCRIAAPQEHPAPSHRGDDTAESTLRLSAGARR